MTPSPSPWNNAAMTKPRLDLYPPVNMPPFPPTWEHVEELALHFPVVHHAVTMVHRGDWTREQALIMLVFALADSFQKLFSAEVQRRQMEVSRPIVLPPELK